MRLEVRCCCVPKKLLGWLDVPRELVREGKGIKFEIPARARLAPLWGGDGPGAVDITPRRTFVLPVAMIYVDGDQHLALKSEETPIETLRQLDGFIENTDA